MDVIKDKQFKYEKALKYEIFEKGEYDFAKEKIQSAKCIFDVWWHIGLFSQWCRLLNSNAEIHYFEPLEKLFSKAKTLLWKDKNIILNNCWIGAKSWNWKILFNSEKTMQSSKYSSFLNPVWEEYNVRFITFEEYLQQYNVEKIDVLKMDIEGMEFEVLDSRRDFEREKVENLIVEVHLLNEKMKLMWDQIFFKIKNIFWNVMIINSCYCEEIFLIWANKLVLDIN